MDFKENPAIYIQIAEYVCEQILLKKWNLGEKIISIRELAVAMEVNPNTVQRAYDFLQQKEIITNKRGVGYFTEDQFMENELPVFMRNIYLLKIDFKEIKMLFDQFVKDNFKNQ
jgi:GntR family transcriptional regulator